MAALEEHIIYERQPFWIFYDEDGLSIAKARCDYLARMATL